MHSYHKQKGAVALRQQKNNRVARKGLPGCCFHSINSVAEKPYRKTGIYTAVFGVPFPVPFTPLKQAQREKAFFIHDPDGKGAKA